MKKYIVGFLVGLFIFVLNSVNAEQKYYKWFNESFFKSSYQNGHIDRFYDSEFDAVCYVTNRGISCLKGK